MILMQVGLDAYMALFSVSPELKMHFGFLQIYHTDDEKFYELVTKHALRVLAVVGEIVKKVCSNIDIVFMKFKSYEINDCKLSKLHISQIYSLKHKLQKKQMMPCMK